jgi:hypothetical protein
VDDDEDAPAGEVDPDGKAARIGLNPRPVTVRYLKQLVALGTHGKNPTQVASRLVDEGIRRALAEGLIDKERDL